MAMDSSTGHQLWVELHTFAWLYPDDPTAEHQRHARAWLADFTRSVRAASTSCDCTSEWRHILDRCPPPLTSRAEFYWWTVAAHDKINRRLARPLAAAEWSLHHTLFTHR